MNKRLTRTLAAVITATSLSSAAMADWRHGPAYMPGPVGHHHYREEHHGGARNWIGPAAVLAITGLAIGAAYGNSMAAPAPQPVYAPPAPRYVAPVSESVWYYCRSSGMYYPYTNACPEGWVAVAGQ